MTKPITNLPFDNGISFGVSGALHLAMLMEAAVEVIYTPHVDMVHRWNAVSGVVTEKRDDENCVLSPTDEGRVRGAKFASTISEESIKRVVFLSPEARASAEAVYQSLNPPKKNQPSFVVNPFTRRDLLDNRRAALKAASMSPLYDESNMTGAVLDMARKYEAYLNELVIGSDE